jgi:hypothetical protein
MQNFFTCTNTYQLNPTINPYPENEESWEAIALLHQHIIIPVRQHFGSENLIITYGFCSNDLRKILSKGKNNVCPAVDQHSAHELNTKGNYICKRLGAACDFRIERLGSDSLISWIRAMHLPFDSIYFYGHHRPIHCSYGPQHKRAVWDMQSGKPRKI